MCGIIGYIGKNNDVKMGINMLKHLEYRGYDCLFPDTLIQLSDGRIKTIGEIEPRSFVSSIDLKKLFYQKSKIQSKAKKIKNKVCRIRTAHFAIKCSEEHRFFVYRSKKIEEKMASELKREDFLICQKKILITGQNQKLPQIHNISYYRLNLPGMKKLQIARKNKKFSYSFLQNKTGVWHQYVKDYFEGGRATTKDNWQKLLSLLDIDYESFLYKFAEKKICSHAFKNIFKGDRLSPTLSQIIGYIIGDGSRLNSKGDAKIKIEDDEQTLKEYRSLFGKIGMTTKILQHRHKNCWQLRIYSASFGKLLQNIAPDALNYSPKREVPEIIQKSTNLCVAGFLRGIFDAEGSVGKRKRDGVSIGLSNEKLVRQIQFLLLRFGIISSLSFSKTNEIKLSIYHYDSLKKFNALINFSCQKKRNDLRSLLYLRKNDRHITLPVLRKLLFLSKIKSIKISPGNYLMYDISVHKTKNFIANGLLVHNSAGLAVYDKKKEKVFCLKKVGRIVELERDFLKSPLDGNPFILHTRWATHGGATKANAHPHWDCQKKIFVVHNGIIENFQAIKNSLAGKGHKFRSETDTEVIPHLIEEFLKQGLGYKEAVRQSLKTVKGSFALLIFNRDYPQLLVGARFSGPLILGVGDNEFIFASDPTPISLITKNVIYLNDGEIAFVENNAYNDYDISGNPARYTVESFLGNAVAAKQGKISFKIEETDKGKFPDFMIKEIFEEPLALENTLRGRIMIDEGKAKFGGLEPLEQRLREINRVILVACGTASYAALAAKYFFEEYAEIPTEVDLASEFRYRKPIINDKSLVIAVSQSGETADTLAAIKEAKTKGALTLGIVNVVGSSIARLVEAGIYSHAGPEMAVASTKAFTTQIADLVLLMIFLARERKMSLVTGKEILNELLKLPEKMRVVLGQAEKIKALAEKYSAYKNFFYLGRKYNFPIALEGSLKLKECAYIHSEAYPAGEMKHGPIALIDEDFPSIVLAPQDSVYEKVVSNIQEIKARKGKVIAVTTTRNQAMEKLADDVIYIPQTLEMLTPLLTVVPLHLFAYYLAKRLGRDVDRPRNLAKSVTVE